MTVSRLFRWIGPLAALSAFFAANAAGMLAIRVLPGEAVIVVDGERWHTSGTDRLDLQVAAGDHRVEVLKEGYQPFSTTVTVRPGETSAVNVSLSKGGE